MKFFASFLLIFFQLLHAVPVKGQGLDKAQVTLALNDESLLSGIKKIEGQTAFRFFYRKADVTAITGLHLALNTRTLEETLTELLKNTGFSFRQMDNNILLEKHQRQTAYVINGRVIGSDHQAIEFATIRIIKSINQKVMATALADREGRFNLTVYEQGDYLLKISSVKTDSLMQKVTVTKVPTIQLPDIILQVSSRQLSGVNITSRRPLISQEADRVIYNLEGDPQAEFSSLLDMMRKVPYLSVDGSDNILLKGSSGYRIFINGKPSAMIERNPKDVLKSIPASTIKSIEVITTPPSKYDAEGLAGIINIITKKEIANGYHGTINVSENGPVGGPGAGAAFTFKEGKLGLSSFAGISQHNVPVTYAEMIRTTTGISPTLLKQENTDLTNSHTGYVGLELGYELDSLNLLSAQFNWSRTNTRGLASQYAVLSGANNQQYRLSNDKVNKGSGLDAALNYQLGFNANKDQLLTFSYRYLKNTNSLLNRIDLFDEINYSQPDYQQSNAAGLDEHTLQADYVQPLGKVIMEAGLKGIFRTNKSDFQYRNLNPISGSYEIDEARSNIFNNSQDVLAAYNSYAYQTTDWQFKAGLRAEETIINGNYTDGNTGVQQKYLNVVPAIVANRKFKDRSSVSIAFSKRIQRPAIAQLNPFVDRSNPNFETSGNPDLKPITSNALVVSYFKAAKGILSVNLGYLYFNSVINAFSSYNPLTNVTLTRYENYGKGRVFKTNIYASYPITDRWNTTFNSDFRQVTFYGMVDQVQVKNSGFEAYVNVTSGYRFEKGWRVNADFTWKSSGLQLPLGRTNGFKASTFSLNKELIQNRLSFSGAISNPFTKYRSVEEQTIGPNFLQETNSQVYHRRFTVSLNYRFGKLKDEIKKNKRGIKNDDLSN